MKDLFSQLLLAVVTVSVPIIATYICNGISAWVKVLKRDEDIADSEIEKNKLEFTNKYLSYLESLVISSVKMVSQTYVDSLKNQNQFTKEKQLEAFKKAYDNVMSILSNDSLDILHELFNDLDSVIRTLIEKSVGENKVIDLTEPIVIPSKHQLDADSNSIAYPSNGSTKPDKKDDGLSIEETALAISEHLITNGETPVTLKMKNAEGKIIPVEFIPESCSNEEAPKGIVYARLSSEEVDSYIFRNIPTIIDYCQTDRGKYDFLDGNIIMYDIMVKFPDGRDERLIFEDFLKASIYFVLVCKLGENEFAYLIDSSRTQFFDTIKIDVIEEGTLGDYYLHHPTQLRECIIDYVYIKGVHSKSQLIAFGKIIDKNNIIVLYAKDLISGEPIEEKITNKNQTD